MAVTLELFNNETEFKPVPAGTTIFREGEAGDAMYVILEGSVELRIGGKTVDTLGPGEVFGEMALIEKAPRIATAIAKDACKLVHVPEKRFMFMVQQTPRFALQIMRVMADRLRRMDRRMQG